MDNVGRCARVAVHWNVKEIHLAPLPVSVDGPDVRHLSEQP